ncbi:MAG: hypothetical protein IPH16_21355 [Haliscomenobacter sp.]|nr:hypothetical protein [Haliscomenobacter sp.]MBK8877333.1 hypothetical protein [Haliscomenobacter sp.]
MDKKNQTLLDLNVSVQVALISGIVFGLLLLGMRLLIGHFLWEHRDLSYYLNTGAALFLLWLVVTAGVRSVHSLRKNAGVFLLWFSGGLTAVAGVLMASVFFALAASIGLDLGARLPTQDVYLFALLIGLVYSLIALIHLKVRRKGLGNALEILVFAGILVLLLYFS